MRMDRKRIAGLAAGVLRVAREIVAFKTGAVLDAMCREASGRDAQQLRQDDPELLRRISEAVQRMVGRLDYWSKFGGAENQRFREWAWRAVERGGMSSELLEREPGDGGLWKLDERTMERLHDAYALFLDFERKSQLNALSRPVAKGLRERGDGAISPNDFLRKVEEMERWCDENLVSVVSEDAEEDAWKEVERRSADVGGGWRRCEFGPDDQRLLSLVAGECTEWCVAKRGNSGKTYYDDYGAPYWMYYRNRRPSALLNVNSEQFKDENDDPLLKADDAVYEDARRIAIDSGEYVDIREALTLSLEESDAPASLVSFVENSGRPSWLNSIAFDEEGDFMQGLHVIHKTFGHTSVYAWLDEFFRECPPPREIQEAVLECGEEKLQSLLMKSGAIDGSLAGRWYDCAKKLDDDEAMAGLVKSGKLDDARLLEILGNLRGNARKTYQIMQALGSTGKLGDPAFVGKVLEIPFGFDEMETLIDFASMGSTHNPEAMRMILVEFAKKFGAEEKAGDLIGRVSHFRSKSFPEDLMAEVMTGAAPEPMKKGYVLWGTKYQWDWVVSVVLLSMDDEGAAMGIVNADDKTRLQWRGVVDPVRHLDALLRRCDKSVLGRHPRVLAAIADKARKDAGSPEDAKELEKLLGSLGGIVPQ